MWFLFPALAASPTSSACDVEGYVAWQAGKVTGHRTPNGEPTTTLTAKRAPGDLSEGPRVHIVASRPGWLHIDRVEEGGVARALDAWIPAGSVRIDLAMSAVKPALMPPWAVPLRAQPESTSTIVRSYLQEPHTAELVGCSGTWLQAAVTVAGESEAATGWLADRFWCANALSTCSTKGGEPPAAAVPFKMTFRVPAGDEARAQETLGVFLSFENTSDQVVEVEVADVALFSRSPEARRLGVDWSMKSVELQPNALAAVFGAIRLPAGTWTLEAVHDAGPASSATFVVQP